MGALGGIVSLAVNGQMQMAKGNWTVNLGKIIREGVPGGDKVHGYTEKVSVPSIEGVITDNINLDIDALANVKDADITLSLNNNKVYALRQGWSCNPDGGSLDTDAGELKVRFEGESMEVIV